MADYRIVVFDQYLYHGRGDVYRWCHKITDTFTRHAEHYAPERSGELRAGIFGDTEQTGVREVSGYIESTAPHTWYVLDGTTGPIMTNKGWAKANSGRTPGYELLWQGKGSKRRQRYVRVKGDWMRIPAFGDFNGHFATAVSGQTPNNFLLKAWRATGRNHTAIRGVRAPDTL